MTSLIKYDSANFPYINESIDHYKDNPFIVDNFTNKLVININSEYTALISEPDSIIKDLLEVFDDYILTKVLPIDEYYKPEQTSKRLYDSHDLWYILLLLNDCMSVKDFNMNTYKYIDPDQIGQISKFLNFNVNTTKVINLNSNENMMYNI